MITNVFLTPFRHDPGTTAVALFMIGLQMSCLAIGFLGPIWLLKAIFKWFFGKDK